ncbi:MAG: hypothetical protein AAF632_12535 [Bacteroidota bacterium]
MKKNHQHPSLSLLSTIVFALIILVASCSQESDTITPQELPDSSGKELSLSVQAPTAAQSPVLSQTHEVTDLLPFPGKSSSSFSARTDGYGVTDYVDFNDEMALMIIPDQAKFTFAPAPYYIQKVGNAWVHVKENSGPGYNPAFTSDYKHYHLSYSGEFCITPNGKPGKMVNGNCVEISNPTKEPRSLDTHAEDQWIKIYAYDYNSSQRVFDLLSIKITNGPVQLWFKKKNGGWLRWSSLGAGTWNLSSYCTDITQVLISASNGTYGSVGFDNVKVKMPYN